MSFLQLTLLDVYESSDLYSTAAMLCCLFNRLPDGEQSPPSPGMIAKCLPTISLEVPGFLSKEGKALFGRMLKDNPANRPTLREAILRYRKQFHLYNNNNNLGG